MIVNYFQRCSEVRSKLTKKGNQGTLVAPLFIQPLLSAVNRTLGIEDYGSAFLDVRGSVGPLYLRNCSAQANFISKPMMISSPDLGCNLHFLFANSLQHRGLPSIITRCEKYKYYELCHGVLHFSSLHMDFQAWGSQWIE